MDEEVQIGEVLIAADRIAARVRELGAAMARAYAGREPVLVAIMKGCVMLLADLVRAWPGPLSLEFVSAESYDGAKPGAVRVALPPDQGERLAGKPVLVVPWASVSTVPTARCFASLSMTARDGCARKRWRALRRR